MSKNPYRLKESSTKRGYDWWWHSSVTTNEITGELKPFLIEYYRDEFQLLYKKYYKKYYHFIGGFNTDEATNAALAYGLAEICPWIPSC